MKKLLLISGLLFSGGLFADMDNMCVVVEVDGQNTHSKIKKCERNIGKSQPMATNKYKKKVKIDFIKKFSPNAYNYLQFFTLKIIRSRFNRQHNIFLKESIHPLR